MDLRDAFTMPHCAFYTAYIDESVIPYETAVAKMFAAAGKKPLQ